MGLGHRRIGGGDVLRKQRLARFASALREHLAQLFLALRERLFRHFDVLYRRVVIGMVFALQQIRQVFLALGDGGLGDIHALARVRDGGCVRSRSPRQLRQVFLRLADFRFGERRFVGSVLDFLRRRRVFQLLHVFGGGVRFRARRDYRRLVARQFRGVDVQIRQRLAGVRQFVFRVVHRVLRRLERLCGIQIRRVPLVQLFLVCVAVGSEFVFHADGVDGDGFVLVASRVYVERRLAKPREHDALIVWSRRVVLGACGRVGSAQVDVRVRFRKGGGEVYPHARKRRRVVRIQAFYRRFDPKPLGELVDVTFRRVVERFRGIVHRFAGVVDFRRLVSLGSCQGGLRLV